MNRIIIAIFALVFVQLVSSQTLACQQAQTALFTDATCSSTDAATVCMGTCRTLYDNVISNCDNAVSSPASRLMQSFEMPAFDFLKMLYFLDCVYQSA